MSSSSCIPHVAPDDGVTKYAVECQYLYMGELNECDEVTGCGGGKNWQVGRRNNNGRARKSEHGEC
jgi:hypothetical protein